jgi:serine phosphatase RsbU (regulator of sigma subunit)/putative methionine-R-sulfoxide reductase with GAF domain
VTTTTPSPVRRFVRQVSQFFGGRQRDMRELATLNEVSRAIIRADLDVDALCELVYRESSKVLDTRWFHLALFDGMHYELKVRVQDGKRLPPERFDLSDDEGLMGWMRRTGRALLVEDFTEELPHLPAQPRYQSPNPPRAGIYVPLLAGDAVIGTLSVQSPYPRTFDADDLRFLSLIADGAAAAISKAQAYAVLRERVAQLELIREVGRRATAILDLDQLLPSVVNLIRDTFHYAQVHLFTVDPLTGDLLFRASTVEDSTYWRGRYQRLKVGVGIVGHVAETRKPMLVEDVSREPRYLRDIEGTQSELAVPLSIGDELLAVLDVQADEPDAFSDSDRFVLQTLADQLAATLDAARTYAEQQEEAWVLAALLQTAENIARVSTLEDLLASVVRLPPLLVGCERCAFMRYSAEDDTFTMVAEWGWNEQACNALRDQPIAAHAAPMLAELRRDRAPVSIRDLDQQPSVLPQVTQFYPSGRLLALPLTARGALMGLLLLDRDRGSGPWDARSITVAVGVANQAASAMESALLAQAAVEQERLNQELRVAREIQTSLLPSEAPRLPGWDIAMAWRSASVVGGDFYDFWHVRSTPDGWRQPEENEDADGDDTAPLGFVIADVSDKGVPAALFMTLARSLLRAAALDGSSPRTAVMRANRWIARDTQSGMFVTVFYGMLDAQTGQLRYTNAGHNPPILLRSDGDVEMLTTPGMALGVIENARLHENETAMHPGDVLVCYTDGITEAINDAEEEYGVARLTEVVARNRERSADALVEAVLADLMEHTGRRPAFDDVTLVLIKRDE